MRAPDQVAPSPVLGQQSLTLLFEDLKQFGLLLQVLPTRYRP